MVHELAHLLESAHFDSFIAILDKMLPNLRQPWDLLSRLPVRHEE